jgi:hypothetical protein
MAATVIERGLDDDLWELLGNCWSENADIRPSIQDVLSRLDLVGTAPLRKQSFYLYPVFYSLVSFMRLACKIVLSALGVNWAMLQYYD